MGSLRMLRLGSRCSNRGGGGGGGGGGCLTTTCTFNCHIVDPTFFCYYALHT